MYPRLGPTVEPTTPPVLVALPAPCKVPEKNVFCIINWLHILIVYRKIYFLCDLTRGTGRLSWRNLPLVRLQEMYRHYLANCKKQHISMLFKTM